MERICLHDRSQIEKVLREHTFLNLYALGDLDKFFWDYTTWYALSGDKQIKQLVLLYAKSNLPVLLGFSAEVEELKELLRFLLPLLPKRFYAHFSGDAVDILAKDYQIRSYGVHYKMALTDRSCLDIDTSQAIALSVENAKELEQLYNLSYPGNWFEPQMLKTGCYYGIRRGDTLVSVAGVHVYSKDYKVAALGNITTHPQWRGQGLGTIVCAKLSQVLLETVEHIGLNVKADNLSAIACYKKAWFCKHCYLYRIPAEIKVICDVDANGEQYQSGGKSKRDRVSEYSQENELRKPPVLVYPLNGNAILYSSF